MKILQCNNVFIRVLSISLLSLFIYDIRSCMISAFLNMYYLFIVYKTSNLVAFRVISAGLCSKRVEAIRRSVKMVNINGFVKEILLK